MTKIVEKTFDEVAKQYDNIKVQIIPNYEKMQKIALDSVNFPVNKHISILEIGTGTGSFALELLNKYTKAKYCGIDLSSKMLEIASHNLKNFKNQIILEKIDINKQKLKGKYDLIISFFTIHHAIDKNKLISSIFNRLNKNGIFINVDITIDNSKVKENQFMQNWKTFMELSSFPNERIKYVIQDHLDNDIPETIDSQIEYLKNVGFSNVKLLFVFEKFTIFYGSKESKP